LITCTATRLPAESKSWTVLL